MPIRTGQKRSRPDDFAQRQRDAHQLDFLAGLRVIENLGADRPTNHDNRFFRDTPLLSVLNFISLLVEADSSRPDRSDIAVAVSADQGHLRLLLAKPNGLTPADAESENLALFIQTLRDSLKDDERKHHVVIERFTRLIAQRHLPELSRKLSRIGTIGGRSPKKNWERFSSFLPLWQQANLTSERSQGFVDVARQTHGLVCEEINTNDVIVETMKRFILHDVYKPPEKMSLQERFYFTKLTMESSIRMIQSNFFHDVVSKGPFHGMLNEEDEDQIFLYEMYRRVNAVAQYLQGLQDFVKEGIPYLIKALGHHGLKQFLSHSGGITAHWVVRGRRNLPRTLYWSSCPEEKICRLLKSNKLAIEDFNDDEYDRMTQEAAVTSLWSKGAPVMPILHPEIQLIRHVERENIAILGWAIGMNQPPCWACFIYIRLLRRFQDPAQRWRMSSTTGRPRGSWMIPPSCHPSLRDSMLCKVEKRVYSAVEEYGFDWAEPWAHADTCEKTSSIVGNPA
ncbi:hypothetical protein C0995_001626 [Termitomyces sp. Mi166|nr:hypothetical protein C0995_001626 [Termitomyces sp. Mi166\